MTGSRLELGKRRSPLGAVLAFSVVVAAGSTIAPQGAEAQSLPEIRLSERNRVPSCVTPEKLNRFLNSGNSNVLPQFRDIARHYKEHGEKWRVRWDYAFYQMLIETNFLKFVNNAGQGDVKPRQNNFAGIGTTGGGVPGDSFPDVSTGVLGQIQHLVVYSGEKIDRPVAPRTRDKQDEILGKSRALGRAPTFKDLAGRWAADKRYGTSIEFMAARFRSAHCNGRQDETVAERPLPQPAATKSAEIATEPPARGGNSRLSRAERARLAREQSSGGSTQTAAASVAAPASVTPGKKAAIVDIDADSATSEKAAQPGARMAGRAVPESKAIGEEKRVGLGAGAMPSLKSSARAPCAVLTASYGGERNVLVRALRDGEVQFTALQVLDGQEERLAQSFIRTHAEGGEAIGQFPTREAALSKAFDLCPAAKTRN